MRDFSPVHVIGAGLAGSEAAWQIARAGVPVILHEMRPAKATPVHQSGDFAELVCSNSFRADDAATSAIGILHREMRHLDSLIMAAADAHQVPAGGALAVDRHGFAAFVTEKITASPLIAIERGEIDALPPPDWDEVIIATGPLTTPALAGAILTLTGEDNLAFFDAIAPIVHRETIDMDFAWFQSRYDKAGPGGTGADYINCPLTKLEYETFVAALRSAETIEFKTFEDAPYFGGCLPIEVMAERGVDTLRHGPMKPFGLTNPRDPAVKAYAVVQLRQDNLSGTLYNMVGFQTKLRHAAQVALFRTIPGLGKAQFARLGGLHRNTFLNSPKILDRELKLKVDPRLRFAGQITGCEGYVESAAIGLVAGRLAAAARRRENFRPFPATTAIGALLNHITGGHIESVDAGPQSFQPMNVNFGLFAPLPGKSVAADGAGRKLRGAERAAAKKQALSARAAADLAAWLGASASLAAE